MRHALVNGIVQCKLCCPHPVRHLLGQHGRTGSFEVTESGCWSQPTLYFPCCATLDKSLSNCVSLDVHWGPTETPAMLKEPDVSHEGLPSLSAMKGPTSTAATGLHRLPARGGDTLSCPVIYLGGLCSPTPSSQGACWVLGLQKPTPERGATRVP